MPRGNPPIAARDFQVGKSYHDGAEQIRLVLDRWHDLAGRIRLRFRVVHHRLMPTFVGRESETWAEHFQTWASPGGEWIPSPLLAWARSESDARRKRTVLKPGRREPLFVPGFTESASEVVIEPLPDNGYRLRIEFEGHSRKVIVNGVGVVSEW